MEEPGRLQSIGLQSVGHDRVTSLSFTFIYTHTHTFHWHNSSLVIIYLKECITVQFSSVQFSLSVVSDSLRPHESQHTRPPCPSPTLGHHQPRLLLPPIPPSIRVLSNESTLRMRWPKYWSFSFSIIPSKEHSGLISFRMDWLDLLAVQGTLKSLLQHHSSKASILWHSASFTVQLSIHT